MAFAVASLISALQISTPPKALSGSPANAADHASSTVSLRAAPHTFVCFMIAKTTSFTSTNSLASCKAASTSTKLLYDNSLPCSWLNISVKSP